jgi:DNA-binding transcriptional LysR family regulator
MDRLTSMAVFVEVATQGGFSSAAVSLDMSPTMVGKHIRFLEARLGARLINRTTRRQGLTEVGRVFLERCQQVLSQVEAAEASAEASRVTPHGLLRISAPMSFGAHLVAPVMLEFLDLYPEVQIDLELTERVVDLVEESTEAAFRIGQISDENLVARELAPYRMVICAAPEYLAGRPLISVPADLIHHECLAFTHWTRHGEWRLIRDGVEHLAPVRSRYRINNGEALRQAALAGHGVVMQPLALLANDLAAGRLVRVLPDYEPPSRPVHLVYLSERCPTAKLRAFIEFALRRIPEIERALDGRPYSSL